MKKFIVILLAMLLVFSMVSCIGDIDIPGSGDDIGGGSGSGSGSGDDPINPPQWENPKSFAQELREQTGATIPENVYFELNSSLDEYKVWKIGENVLLNWAHYEIGGDTNEWIYYKVKQTQYEDGVVREYIKYEQDEENSGPGNPFYWNSIVGLDQPFIDILWQSREGTFTTNTGETEEVNGRTCTIFENPTAASEGNPDTPRFCYVDLATGLIQKIVTNDSTGVLSFEDWKTEGVAFPFTIVLDPQL